jgi:hypothetical protein
MHSRLPFERFAGETCRLHPSGRISQTPFPTFGNSTFFCLAAEASA